MSGIDESAKKKPTPAEEAEKARKKASAAFAEIGTAETKYLNNLTTFKDQRASFIKSLNKKERLQFKEQFTRIDALIKNLQPYVLLASEADNSPKNIQAIMNWFINTSSTVAELYDDYLRTHELKITKILASRDIHDMYFGGYLMMPVQHAMRYSMLLDAYKLRIDPSETELINLVEKASEIARSFSLTPNNKIKAAENAAILATATAILGEKRGRNSVKKDFIKTFNEMKTTLESKKTLEGAGPLLRELSDLIIKMDGMHGQKKAELDAALTTTINALQTKIENLEAPPPPPPKVGPRADTEKTSGPGSDSDPETDPFPSPPPPPQVGPPLPVTPPAASGPQRSPPPLPPIVASSPSSSPDSADQPRKKAVAPKVKRTKQTTGTTSSSEAPPAVPPFYFDIPRKSSIIISDTTKNTEVQKQLPSTPSPAVTEAQNATNGVSNTLNNVQKLIKEAEAKTKAAAEKRGTTSSSTKKSGNSNSR